MKVTLYQLDTISGNQVAIATVSLKNQELTVEATDAGKGKKVINHLLEPKFSAKLQKIIGPKENPEEFLKAIAETYRSGYLSAILEETPEVSSVTSSQLVARVTRKILLEN